LGKGIFFTPGKIAKARKWEEMKTRKAEDEAAAKAAKLAVRELKKAADEAERERKRAKRKEDQLKRAKDRDDAAKRKAEQKAEKMRKATANRKAPVDRQVRKRAYRRTKKAADEIRRQSTIGQEVLNARSEEKMDIDEAPRVTRLGRSVKKPARFQR
jgi:hypothetical protein